MIYNFINFYVKVLVNIMEFHPVNTCTYLSKGSSSSSKNRIVKCIIINNWFKYSSPYYFKNLYTRKEVQNYKNYPKLFFYL